MLDLRDHAAPFPTKSANAAVSLTVVTVDSAGRESPFIDSVMLEDAAGRVSDELSLPMVLSTCALGAPCHVEFTLTVQFTEAFVSSTTPHTVTWRLDLQASSDGEPFSDTADCADGARGHVTIGTISVELEPGVPGGGLVDSSRDAGVPDGG